MRQVMTLSAAAVCMRKGLDGESSRSRTCAADRQQSAAGRTPPASLISMTAVLVDVDVMHARM